MLTRSPMMMLVVQASGRDRAWMGWWTLYRQRGRNHAVILPFPSTSKPASLAARDSGTLLHVKLHKFWLQLLNGTLLASSLQFLIFVISFTRTKFLGSIFYTQNYTKYSQKVKHAFFEFNQEKFTPDRSFLRKRCPWRP